MFEGGHCECEEGSRMFDVDVPAVGSSLLELFTVVHLMINNMQPRRGDIIIIMSCSHHLKPRRGDIIVLTIGSH